MANETIKAGKKAGLVTYQVGDTWLAREYNPNPANPRSQKQVAHRAKIKLLSQLAAVFRPIIAIFPASGKSARSIFLADNWQFVDGHELIAEYVLQFLRLTHSDISLVPIVYNCFDSEAGWLRYIMMVEEPPQSVNVMFYYLFIRDEQGKLFLLQTWWTDRRQVLPDREYFRWFCRDIKVDDNGHTIRDYYVLAFGMCYLSEHAQEVWEESEYPEPEFIAPQIKLGLITPDLFQFTETKFLFIPQGS